MENPIKSLPVSTTTTPVGPDLSAPLTSWLLVETSDHKAIDVIAKSPILREEAQAAIPALRAAALAPATQEQIKATISQRFALFTQPQRTPSEWAAWWADYFDALSGMSAPAVEAGMAAWVKHPDAEFMCKPGKLLELAKTAPSTNKWVRAHKIAVAACVEIPHDADQPKSPELVKQDAETVAALLRDFHKQIKAREVQQVSRTRSIPTPSAPVDGSGMSEGMRSLLERQGTIAPTTPTEKAAA